MILHVVVLICKVRHTPRQDLMVKVESIAYPDGWLNSGRAQLSSHSPKEVILAFVLLSGDLLLKALYSLG